MSAAPLPQYEQKIHQLTLQRNKLQTAITQLGWARTATVVVLAFTAWNLYSISLPATLLSAALLITVFLRLVVLSARRKETLQNTLFLLRINQEEINIAAGQYSHLPDGHELTPGVHDYAHDLDIFGRYSLYQYINRTTTEQSQHLLAQWLLEPASPEAAISRQQAARELAPQLEWRQQLQAHGMHQQIKQETENRIGSWLQAPDQFTGPQWTIIRFAGPVIMLSALAAYISDWLSSSRLIGLIALFFVISSLISRKVTLVYIQLDKIVQEISTLSSLVSWIEQTNPTADLLKEIRALCIENDLPASAEITRLKAILNRMEYRMNPMVFLPMNIFLLWDLQQVLALEAWKRTNAGRIAGWFRAVAQMEALTTLATLQFNHPGWTYPVFTTEPGVLDTENIGHPLIAQTKRITSSFTTAGTGKIALITGSNMAGKSTFLRSIGVNLVLAMMGAPVCASRFTLSAVRVMSSMRITDNLEENTSTFYAELKKLRHIIEEVNKGEKVYLLLDEILRGTNSLDRHAGSKALIEQLIRQHSTGMVATHDIELASLQNKYPQAITNYHFDVQVANEELYFDYKLKSGVCQSMNASILMKKIGIVLESED